MSASLAADDAAELCRAGAAARRGGWVPAVEAYTRALDEAGAPVCAYVGAASAYRELGLPELARELLAEGAQRHGRSTAIVLELARAFADLGLFDRASEQVDRALEIDSASQLALVAFAEIQIARGDLPTARTTLERVLRSDATIAAAHSVLGVVLHRLGELSAAVESSTRAVELDPADSPAHLALAASLADLGRVEDARNVLSRLVEREPLSAAAHYRLARTLLRVGRDAEARESLRRYRQVEARRRYERGAILQKKGSKDAAIGAYEQSLDVYPGFVNAHSALGLLYLDRGDVNAALRSALRAAKLDPRAARLANVALIYHLANQREEALEWIDKALAAEPGRRAFAQLRRRIVSSDPEGQP